MRGQECFDIYKKNKILLAHDKEQASVWRLSTPFGQRVTLSLVSNNTQPPSQTKHRGASLLPDRRVLL
jgi:hypothetical protein